MIAHRIIPRSEWGANYPDGHGQRRLPATEAWLHHSVTIAPDLLPPFTDDYEAVRQLERIGQSRFGRGISYTFPVSPAGLVFQGHSTDRVGTHTAGHNTAAVGICLIGNYEDYHPSPQQVDAVGWLLAHLFLNGQLAATRLTGGHRDVKGTSCPGRHAYDLMGAIDARAHHHATAVIYDLPPQEDDMALPATEVPGRGPYEPGHHWAGARPTFSMVPAPWPGTYFVVSNFGAEFTGGFHPEHGAGDAVLPDGRWARLVAGVAGAPAELRFDDNGRLIVLTDAGHSYGNGGELARA